MTITLRPGAPGDAAPCGDICYRAFKTISEQHGFPPDFPSADAAAGLLAVLLADANTYSVVAEVDGAVVGSNFMSIAPPIAGIGPITVDPRVQDDGVGRRLMAAALERAGRLSFAGVRLVQAAFHNRSLSLYTKLGFDTREPLSNLRGPAIAEAVAGHPVRPARLEDLEACGALCRAVHGYDRSAELRAAIERRVATVVECAGRVTGYAAPVAFFGHAVAAGNDDLKALIAAAPGFAAPGFLLPTRNGELLRWCLARGLRIAQPMTLMSRGLYNEPRGAFLPSILF